MFHKILKARRRPAVPLCGAGCDASPPFLRGHYGCYGRPHNYPALNGFYREVRRTWLRCLRRRSQKSRRMGWPEFETLTACFSEIVLMKARLRRIVISVSQWRQSRVRGLRRNSLPLVRCKLAACSSGPGNKCATIVTSSRRRERAHNRAVFVADLRLFLPRFKSRLPGEQR